MRLWRITVQFNGPLGDDWQGGSTNAEAGHITYLICNGSSPDGALGIAFSAQVGGKSRMQSVLAASLVFLHTTTILRSNLSSSLCLDSCIHVCFLLESEAKCLLVSEQLSRIRLTMSSCKVTCVDWNSAYNLSSWPSGAPNLDISGIGVRSSTYALSPLTVDNLKACKLS